MDTKTLVVGQDVRVHRRNCYYGGKVVKVTSSGVEVQTDYDKEPLRFDSNGRDGTGTFECGPALDTKTLVVGQEVYMSSGIYCCEGKVVKVTPNGVEVQVSRDHREEHVSIGGVELLPRPSYDELLHFDENRRSYVTELPSSYDGTAHPLSPWRWDGNGTFECGPWYIDDMPFAEREALFERAAQRFQKWNSMNCEHSKVGDHYYIEKCPICGCENPNYNPITAKEWLQGRLPK
jgi:preprotein translocase subunit YajC